MDEPLGDQGGLGDPFEEVRVVDFDFEPGAESGGAGVLDQDALLVEELAEGGVFH